MRISYYLKQKDPDKSVSPWLMADVSDRPAMLHVREDPRSQERPEMLAVPSKPETTENDTVFERITEWTKIGHAADLRQYLPRQCRNWVRFVSPINDASQSIEMGKIPPPAKTVTDGMCVIVSARQLAASMRLRLQSSYEAMAVDLIRAWNWQNPENHGRFASLFGCKTPKILARKMSGKQKHCYAVCRLPGGALLIYGGDYSLIFKGPGSPSDHEPKAYLIFDRSRPADIRHVGSGTAKGTGMLVAASIAKALAQPNDIDFRTRLLQGAEEALRVTTAYLEKGVICVIHNHPSNHNRDRMNRGGAPGEISVKIETLDLTIKTVCSRENIWSIVGRKLEILASPRLDEERSKREKTWRWEALFKEKKAPPSDDQDPLAREREHYYKAGLILLSSDASDSKRFLSVKPKGSSSRGSLSANTVKVSDELFKEIPLVKFGDLELIDREEIQDYIAIQNILLNYLESRALKPLNLGVFGPPGSGKSFGTKEILKHIGRGGNTFQDAPYEFNLSQFRSLDDLAQALHMVRDEGLRDKMPVAFFDEFDSAFQGKSYGWLQYLLAPMQDGKFWDGGREYTLGKCVLVFAGGVNRRFEEMNGRLRDPGFCAAKGPDFISRLRGVLNIKGVNRPDERSDQGRFLLRRAVLLRSMVSRVHKDAGAPVPEPLMDAFAAAAFLKIDGFRHGNRSMDAILRMSHLQPGRTLRAAELPPLEQLEIHVDGKHFTEFVKIAFTEEHERQKT